VDVEVWARRFLVDVDRFLTVPYATGVYANVAARGTLDTVLDAKSTLSSAIPRGLAAVLDLTDPLMESGREEAAGRLGQQLAIGLGAAYDTAAIVQYDATITSAWTQQGSTLSPARLVGTARELAPGTGPAYSLTSAKTDLTATSSFVTFLLRLPDPAHHRNVTVHLDYDLLDLELNITSVPNVSGYEASNWLRFVPALSGLNRPAVVHTTLDPATVPIPLRSYPALPTLLGQTARASFADSPHVTLAEAVQWTYGLSYAHEHAEQDEVFVTAAFNLPPFQRRAGDPQSVASALARYVAIADDLWGLLAGYALPGQADPTTLANAARTFADLASEVATAWDQRWPAFGAADDPGRDEAPAGGSGGPTMQSFSFRARITNRTDAGVDYLDTLSLIAEQDSPSPGGTWPNAFCRAPDGQQVALVAGRPDGRHLVYQFPADTPIPAVEWPRITLEWPGLDVAAQQNARASLSVQRNQGLLGNGPDTTAGFIYQTPSIDAPDVVTPLNAWPDPIDITAGGATVQVALASAFQVLFGTAMGLPLTLGASYGFEVVAGANGTPGLTTYLPVSLYPNQQLGTGTVAAMASALAAWQTANEPATLGGEWVLSLTLFSQIEPGARRPLLAIDRLVYHLST
jgi:hypothetical protein